MQKKNVDFLCKALQVAKKGLGTTSPNPTVGAILVKNNNVIARGVTQIVGRNHAEIEAIKKAGSKARGSSLYVTLEPCCITGRTGPCTEAIIKAGIKNVFIGMKDPNPRINGRGARQLQKAGLKVFLLSKTSSLAIEIRSLNQPFIKAITTGAPYVTLKAGVSLDGKIATYAGNSQWITGELSRKDSRLERSMHDAVIVGAGTVAADDPELAPHGKYKDKKLLRVIIDGQLSSDIEKKVFRDSLVLVACATSAPIKRQKLFLKKGIPFKTFGTERVSIEDLLRYLGEQKIRSVFVEGGAEIHGAFVDARQIDSVLWYIAPKIIGGRSAVSAVAGNGVAMLSDVIQIKNVSVKTFGNDLKVTGLVNFY
jgi:diaminohydroxyphosphoribosylaminopyrimidine deaminase/5-amino-6-(5-phosphoribosylamino)uracil reductase